MQAGKIIVGMFGRVAAPLRFWSIIQVLLGALLLSLAVWRIWKLGTAVLTLGFILTSGLVLQQARLFRPDPMMLAWEMMGLGAVLLAGKYQQRKWWVIAGAAYGVAVLYKPFGVFPLVGLVGYFGHQLWSNRDNWRQTFGSGLTFAISFLFVTLALSALLYYQIGGFYYLEPLNQHLNLNLDNPFSTRIQVAIAYYGSLFIVNGIFLFILPLWILNRRTASQSDLRVLVWQLASPLIFLAITRPIFLRYYVFLIPLLAVLAARQFSLTLDRIAEDSPAVYRLRPIFLTLFLLIAFLATRPTFSELITKTETDTLALAQFVTANTQPDDLVLTDYAGINFFANRNSIYEASIIAAGRIKGGVITGQLLIERMEQTPVKMVLIHVEGGRKSPDHLLYLSDYEQFQAYLDENFNLLTEFDRDGQRILIYNRE